jgi:hypothetical protein
MGIPSKSTNTIKGDLDYRMKKKSGSKKGKPPSQLKEARISDLGDWRGRTLARVRQLIKESDPDIVEEVKWRKPSNLAGVPVWYRNGGICTGETYKDHVKFTFFNGASLEDPSHLFNQPGTVRRAIDFHEGDSINEAAFKSLIREAVALNLKSKGKP